MAVRAVVRYPDPVLKRPADPVASTGVDELVRDLVDTMRAGPATVGLAAPQVGRSVRACVVDASGHPRVPEPQGLLVLLDPVVVEAHGADLLREGCLSVPELTANVRRATDIRVRARDAEGAEREHHLVGFEARIFLHELDHLDGLLILDRAASPSDLFARKVYR